MAKKLLKSFVDHLGDSYQIQFINLVNWLGEWEDYLRTKKEEKKDFRHYSESGEEMSVSSQIESDKINSFYKTSRKKSEVGQIRLVKPGVFEGLWTPCFIALYAQSPVGMLTCQFSVLTTPATPGEFKTGRQESHFSVLCPWNSFFMKERDIQRYSWYVGQQLTDEEINKAQRLHRALMRGLPFDQDVEDQIGPPIGELNDQRWEYLQTLIRSVEKLRYNDCGELRQDQK